MNSYQLAIHDTINLLTESKEKVVDQIFQIAINDELKDWSNDVGLGEHFYFSKELFKSLKDLRVKKTNYSS